MNKNRLFEKRREDVGLVGKVEKRRAVGFILI